MRQPLAACEKNLIAVMASDSGVTCMHDNIVDFKLLEYLLQPASRLIFIKKRLLKGASPSRFGGLPAITANFKEHDN